MPSEINKKENCLKLGKSHPYEFKIATYGYSCWVCPECGDIVDEVEDCQP